MNQSQDDFWNSFSGNEYTEVLWNVVRNMSITPEQFPLLWDKPVGELLTVCADVLQEDEEFSSSSQP